MIIIEDTREQKALDFDTSGSVELVARHKLDYGDYSAHSQGKVCRVFFDRKGLGDLFGTLSKGNERFKREIKRCVDDGNRLIIIVEAPLSKVLKGFSRSKIPGLTIVKTLFTLTVKYNVQCVFSKDRADMQHYIENYFSAWERNLK